MSNISNALLITGIGMGLVFIAILLLWGMMELMMRIGARIGGGEDAEGSAEAETGPEEAVDSTLLRRKAAAAAVAVALSLVPEAQASLTLPSSVNTSAWQSVRRAGQTTMRSSAYSRRQRGS